MRQSKLLSSGGSTIRATCQLSLLLLAVLSFSGCDPATLAAFGRALQGGDASYSGGAAFSGGHRCPTCNANMFNTGGTEVEWGQLRQIWACPNGHRYSFASGRAVRSPSYVKDPCPTCGSGTIWTGRTYVEWGKMHYVHQCPVGHQSVKVK